MTSFYRVTMEQIEDGLVVSGLIESHKELCEAHVEAITKSKFLVNQVAARLLLWQLDYILDCCNSPEEITRITPFFEAAFVVLDSFPRHHVPVGVMEGIRQTAEAMRSGEYFKAEGDDE